MITICGSASLAERGLLDDDDDDDDDDGGENDNIGDPLEERDKDIGELDDASNRSGSVTWGCGIGTLADSPT
ncbi:MAG: hypothetical protein K2Q14_02180 [Gammaproteobacteria bacterium]|nr:hypothetical protein [Gammaproteobacteria bacterium]